jgi:hypothetical protein
MVTRHGDEAARPSWQYPEDLEGFLAAIGASLTDPDEARWRVEIFMHGPKRPAASQEGPGQYASPPSYFHAEAGPGGRLASLDPRLAGTTEESLG